MPKREKNELGQYFTPPAIAQLMVGMMSSDKSLPVLEPSSGQGVFLDALLASGRTSIEGVELDKSLATHKHVAVHNESFVTWSGGTGYGAVIGNPPYIRWRDLDDRSKTELQAHELWGTLFTYLTDYLTVFIAKSVQLLEEGGELLFITPRFWMHTQGSSVLREWLLSQGSITHIVDFDEAVVFPGVSTSIIVFRYVKGISPEPVTLHNYVGPRQVPAEISLEDKSLFAEVSIPAFTPGNHWTFGTEEQQIEIKAFENWCRNDEGKIVRLGEYIDIANGLVSGLDVAFQIPLDQLDSLNELEKVSTIQVLKAKHTNRLVSSETIPYIYVPFQQAEKDFEQDYPFFASLLSTYQDRLLSRHSYAEGLRYWEWAFPRSAPFHLDGRQKIMVPVKERLTTREHVRFTIAPAGAVATQDMVAFVPDVQTQESIEYIVAFLTLPQVTKWVTFKGVVKNNVAEFGVQPLSNIPFRSINWENSEEVAAHEAITILVRQAQSSSATDIFEQVQSVFEDGLAMKD